MHLKFKYAIPAAIWMGIIFLFSTDLFAANQTGSMVEYLLFKWFPEMSLDQIRLIHIGLRKCAHIFAFGMLSLFFSMYFSSTFYPWTTQIRNHSIKAIFASIAYACFDEWHQSFSAVRTGTIIDVGWDALGIFIAQIMLKTKASIF